MTTPTLPLADMQAVLDAKYGPVNPILLAERNRPELREQYRQAGADIRSSRILTDGKRLLGLAYAWFEQASPELRRKLRGFSIPMLQAAVHYALELQQGVADAGDSKHNDDSARAASDLSLSDAVTRAFGTHGQLVTALSNAVSGKKAQLAKINQAATPTNDPGALATSLQRLVAFGRDFLKDADGPTTVLAEAAQVDTAYLDEVQAEAEQLATVATNATVRLTAQKLSQGDLDVLDGVNLHIMGDMIDAFEKAHDLDGTIPRMVPISTRRVLGTVRSRPSDPTEPEADAPLANPNA